MSDDFYRKLDEAEIKGRNERIFRDRPANLHDYQGCEHMPWVQANREYHDGYNTGIAAAIAKLKRIENGVRTYPVDATSPDMQLMADSVNEICHTLIPKLARELESLFRNPFAPPSE
jgi:hypothetical protein